MKIRRIGALGAALAVGALVLSACAPSDPGDEVTTSPTETGTDPTDEVPGDPIEIRVGWNQPFYSYNDDTDHGNALTNANILYLTRADFNYYDGDLNLVPDTTYGTYEKTSDDPLTVTYTVNEDRVWSDGTPIDAADLLLGWAAVSGNFNDDSSEFPTDDDGATVIPDDAVFFSSPSPGLALVSQVPEIGADGRSVTLVYDEPFADWETAFGTGVPAHVVAKLALEIEDAQEAKDALIAAIQGNDRAALAAIANTWRTAFDFTSLPDNPDLYLSSGAYVISEYVEGQYLTVEKNELYTGLMEGKADRITTRYNEDPMALVQALENREIDMLSPQATADTLAALQALPGVHVENHADSAYEHVDFVVDQGGAFDPATYGGDEEVAKLVRQAFLKTIPRQQIVDQLIVPLQPNAEVRQSFILAPDAPNYAQMIAENGSDFYPLEADLDGARDLLEQAGVETPIDVRVLYGLSNVRRANQFVLIKESADQAGFNVIDGGDDNWGILLDTATDTYDAALFAWVSTSLAVTAADANYRTAAPNNWYGYSNAEVDALFDELQTETDPQRQFEIQLGVEQHLWADAFGTTIFQHPGVSAWAEDVTGVQPLALSPTLYYGFWEWDRTS